MAGAINTTNTILDLGSYNQATATLMYCTILFLYHPEGGEVKNCSKCQNFSIIVIPTKNDLCKDPDIHNTYCNVFSICYEVNLVRYIGIKQ